ncbi:MAG: hypothetical protein K2O70_01485, partial [Desulfovibrionaceae bacterium]|nr:hypothetical protein [Desulfovibrionaceae bacterium]
RDMFHERYPLWVTCCATADMRRCFLCNPQTSITRPFDAGKSADVAGNGFSTYISLYVDTILKMMLLKVCWNMAQAAFFRRLGV